MTTRIAWPDSPFWAFSLEIYGRPGVEDACLDLQRRLDLDVNLLLLCCWLATHGVHLDEAAARRVAGAVEGWRIEVVRPLRAVRRRLKVRLADPERGTVFAATPDIASALRAGVIDLELDAEHLEQLVLEEAVADLSPDTTPGAAVALHNVGRFWPLDAAHDGALQTVIAAVFPDAGEAELNAPVPPARGPRGAESGPSG